MDHLCVKVPELIVALKTIAGDADVTAILDSMLKDFNDGKLGKALVQDQLKALTHGERRHQARPPE